MEDLNDPTKVPSAIHAVGPFILGKTLGQGATGKVKLAFHKDTGFKVAVKIIEKDQLSKKPTMRKKIEREVAVMKLINHPNVLKLFDVYQTEEYLFLILEYAPGGELFDFLVERGSLEPDIALGIFQQLVNGIDCCHKFRVCHRDLKPENLLLDANNNMKIADFGMGTVQFDGDLLKTSCGSPHYASPEVVRGNTYTGVEADVWSCGVILYALLTGKLPFDDDNIRVLLGKVKLGQFSIPPYLPPGARDLIQRMLTVDPDQRISLDEVKRHPWYLSNRATPEVVLPILQRGEPPLGLNEQPNTELLQNLEALGCGTSEEIIPRLRTPGSIESQFYRILDARARNPEFNVLVQAGDPAIRRGRSNSYSSLPQPEVATDAEPKKKKGWNPFKSKESKKGGRTRSASMGPAQFNAPIPQSQPVAIPVNPNFARQSPPTKKKKERVERSSVDSVGDVPVTKISRFRSGSISSDSSENIPGSPILASSSPKRSGVFSFLRRRSSRSTDTPPSGFRVEQFGVPSSARIDEILEVLQQTLASLQLQYDTLDDGKFSVKHDGGLFTIDIVSGGAIKHPKMQADAKYFINFTFTEGDPEAYNKLASQIETLL